MNRTIWIAPAILCVWAAGCGAADEVEATPAAAALTTATTAAAVPDDASHLLPSGAEHLYFGRPSTAYVDDENPYGYRYFTAAAGHPLQLRAQADGADGAAAPVVDFKLQRATLHGRRWSWTVVAYGKHLSGAAAAELRYTPPATAGNSLYLVTAVAASHPATLTVSLACPGGGCATAQQPGEACGGFSRTPRACDEGLFCDYAPGPAMCGYADARGTCSVRPEFCPALYMPVCGCDGTTYSNGCRAAAAGQGVLRKGPCDVDVTGAWEQQAPDGSVLDYTFNPDGTFVSTERPACVFANPPCAVKLVPGEGTYTLFDSTTLHLSYARPETHTPMATSFRYELRAGVAHLSGDDYGYSLDLTRLP